MIAVVMRHHCRRLNLRHRLAPVLEPLPHQRDLILLGGYDALGQPEDPRRSRTRRREL
jgi:hypothetical protein